MIKKSHLAPVSRSTFEEIQVDHQFIAAQKLFIDIFDSLIGISAVLDSNRQIVYSNDELLKMLGINSIESIIGKRPGEVVSCIHSSEEPDGCGTAEACSYCGATTAILESQRTGKKSTKETRISASINEKLISWDLRISSIPIILSGKTFYILTLQDISNEKRRSALERIFFHDLLNSVGGLNGLLSILKEGVDPNEEDEIINLSEEACRNILEEIISHRQIRAAEDGNIRVKIESINSREFLTSSISKISSHPVGKARDIVFDESSPEICFDTDRILSQRVIINLLKNALEATPENGSVSLGVEDLGDKVKFWVKNMEVIPKEVQAQIFQRSFSTKGTDRGIGTYSIKLLIENYLNGKVSFISNEQDRTIFSVEMYKKWPE